MACLIPNILLTLVRNENFAGKGIGAAAKAIEKNIEQAAALEGEDDDEEDVDDAPIFTPELARLKAKEAGKELPDEDEDDAEMDADDEEGGDKNKGRDAYPDEFSDSEEEKEDYTIRKTDSILVAATAESDHSNLEIYIYEHEKANLYVHHEVILGAYPLCLEWIPKWQDNKANLIAVGTFLPEIEIWNLDSESCDPVCILGDVSVSEAAKEEHNKSQANLAKKYKKKGNVPATMAYSE